MGSEQKPRFGIIFRTNNHNALDKIKNYIQSTFDDAVVVYSVGPTDQYLWVLVGKVPRGEGGRCR